MVQNKKTSGKKPVAKKVNGAKSSVAKKTPVKKAMAKKSMPVKKASAKNGKAKPIMKKGNVSAPVVKTYKQSRYKKLFKHHEMKTVFVVVALLILTIVGYFIKEAVINAQVDNAKQIAKENGVGFEVKDVDYSIFSDYIYLKDVELTFDQIGRVKIYIEEIKMPSNYFNTLDNPRMEIAEAGEYNSYLKGITVDKSLYRLVGLTSENAIDIYEVDEVHKDGSFKSNVKIDIRGLLSTDITLNILDQEKMANGYNAYIVKMEELKKKMEMEGKVDFTANEDVINEILNNLFKEFVFSDASIQLNDKGAIDWMKKMNPKYDYAVDMMLVDIKHNQDLDSNAKVVANDFVDNPEKISVDFRNENKQNLFDIMEVFKADNKKGWNDYLTIKLNGKEINLNNIILKAQDVSKVEVKDESHSEDDGSQK